MPKSKTKSKKRALPKGRGLTIKQVNYKKLRLGGHSKYSAARLAGYSHTTASTAKQNIESTMPGFARELEMAGLTDKALAKMILEGTQAMKVQACDIYVTKDENGKPMFDDGKSFIDVPDWQVRHKFIETALRDRSLAKLDKGPLVDASEHTHLTIVVDNEEKEEVNAGGDDPSNKEAKLRVALTD